MRPMPVEVGLFAILMGAVLIALIAIVGGFLHSRRQQLMAHQERMKALELGREVPDEIGVARAKAVASAGAGAAEERSYAGKCFSTTGYACFFGFLFAAGAAAKEGGDAPGAAYAIAAAAGAVGVTGLICGTVLAARAPASTGQPVKARYDHDGI
jgi:hypothetical protein